MRAVFEKGDEHEKFEKSLLLGREFLGGNWSLLTKEDLEIRKILGGLSNLLFLVSTNSKKLRDEETRKFLVRIHCQPVTPHQIAQDTVVFAILAERGLGPKIYGFFEGGRLEEYLESRTFKYDDILLEENARKIGATFRKFHTLQLPISKKPSAIPKMRQWLEEFRHFGGESHEIVQTQTSYPNIPKVVTSNDLEHELNVFEEMCTVFDDSVVFSHNDLAAPNILELNNTKEVIFIDFEFALYNWRGFDIGHHLSEYAFDNRVEGKDYLLHGSIFENHPNLRAICSSYLNSQNCDELMEECRFFWPLCNLFFAIYSLRMYTEGIDNGSDWRSATSDRLALYFYLKNRSIEIYEKRKF